MVSSSTTTKTPKKTRVAKAIRANEYRTLRQGDAAILFYKEECGYCRRFKPAWNEVAKRIASQDGDLSLPVVKVNIKKYPFVSKEEQIRTVPHIKFFKKGRDPIQYTGSREPDDVYQALIDYYRHDIEPQPIAAASPMATGDPATLSAFAQILRRALMEKRSTQY